MRRSIVRWLVEVVRGILRRRNHNGRRCQSISRGRSLGLLKSILLSVCPLVAFPAAVCAQQATPMTRAAAQGFEGKWRGEMSCSKLSFTKGPQKVPMEVIVSGSNATFARKVWNEDNSAVVGTEEGGGEVEAIGAMKLSSEWRFAAANPRYTFSGSYAGNLKSGVGSLRGTQVWKFDGKTENRTCLISLKR